MPPVVTQSDRVTISVACFRANRYVRRAVESLLAQTHPALTLVVLSDGDPDPPWRELESIGDPRLVRFSLTENHGPYFAHQVALAASDTPYFMVHDADDWSAPDRVATLVKALTADRSDLAFSAWQQYREGADGVARKDSIRWRRRLPSDLPARPGGPTPEPFLFDPMLTEDFLNRATHHGIFRREALQNIGGCFGGFRMNYDTLLTNLVLMTGKVSFIEEPLYHYTIRPDSLSHGAATGARSQARTAAKAQQEALYREAFRCYKQWMKGELGSGNFLSQVRELTGRFVTPRDRATLASETARLTEILHSRTSR